jgi:hypothetical protein
MKTAWRGKRAAIVAAVVAALLSGCAYAVEDDQAVLNSAALSVEHVVDADIKVTRYFEGHACKGTVTLDVSTAEEISQVVTNIDRAFRRLPNRLYGCGLSILPNLGESEYSVRIGEWGKPLRERDNDSTGVDDIQQEIEDFSFGVDRVFEVKFHVAPRLGGQVSCDGTFITDVSTPEEASSVIVGIRQAIDVYPALRGRLMCRIVAIADQGQFSPVVNEIIVNENIESAVRIDADSGHVIGP